MLSVRICIFYNSWGLGTLYYIVDADALAQSTGNRENRMNVVDAAVVAYYRHAGSNE
jgi:hypothetical protein